MALRLLVCLIAALCWVASAYAQIGQGGIRGQGQVVTTVDNSANVVLVSVKQYGAKVDTLALTNGVTTAGSAVFTRSDGGAFANADIGKTIVVNGAGTNGDPLVTKIVSILSATQVTMADTASFAVSFSTNYLYQINSDHSSSNSGSGYAPNDTVLVTGGSCALEPTITIARTKVVSATVHSGGSGGTNGTTVVVGTTGTGRQFRANVNVSGGAITAVNGILYAGDYTVNPTVLTSEPVTGDGLAGATLSVTMGWGWAYISNPGNCSSFPASPVAQGTSSGVGTGATFNLIDADSSSAPGGTWLYGTDDTTAFQAGVNAISIPTTTWLNSNGGGVGGNCLFIPAGTMLISSTINVTASYVCIQGLNRTTSGIAFTDASKVADAIAVAGSNRCVVSSACQFIFRNLSLSRVQNATAGALLHFTGGALNWIEENNFSHATAFDVIRMDANNATSYVFQTYIRGNEIFNAQNDGIRLVSNVSPPAFLGDIFIERRNYIGVNGLAGVELSGNLQGTFIVGNVDFGNQYGILLDIGSFSTSVSGLSNTWTDNDIDTNQIAGIWGRGVASTIIRNHEFNPNIGVFCSLCANVNSHSNYEGGGHHLVLEGSLSWTEAGSIFTGSSAPVIAYSTFNQSSVDQPTKDLNFAGAFYSFGNGIFLTCLSPNDRLSMTDINLVGMQTDATSGGAVVSSGCRNDNYVNWTGGTDANSVDITARGPSADVNLVFSPQGVGGYFFNSSGNALNGGTIFKINGNSGTVANSWSVSGATASNTPILNCQGSDTNVGCNFTTQGTGAFVFNPGTNNTATFQINNANNTGAVLNADTLNSILSAPSAFEVGRSSGIALAGGELGFAAPITSSASAPGATGLKLAVRCGTNAGTAKIVAYAGTSSIGVTVLDNIGAGVTGC